MCIRCSSSAAPTTRALTVEVRGTGAKASTRDESGDDVLLSLWPARIFTLGDISCETSHRVFGRMRRTSRLGEDVSGACGAVRLRAGRDRRLPVKEASPMRPTHLRHRVVVISLVFGLASLPGEGMVRPQIAWGQDEMYVANSFTSSITVYART